MIPRALLLSAAALMACVDPEPGDGLSSPADGEPVAELVIDRDGLVELDPGAGVGVAVAYLGAGRWQLMAACDTAVTDTFCQFDVLVSVAEGGAELIDIEGVELEAEDDLVSVDPFELQLRFVTGEDLDGAVFSTSPGTSVRVYALLYDPVQGSPADWTADPRMLSWVGHGALNWGAPTNPVALVPDQP